VREQGKASFSFQTALAFRRLDTGVAETTQVPAVVLDWRRTGNDSGWNRRQTMRRLLLDGCRRE